MNAVTLRTPVTLTGMGLHSGLATTVRLLPEHDGRGVRFIRVDRSPAVVIRASPMLPGVIRAVEPAFLGLDDRIDAIRIRSRNGDADLAQDSAGKTIALEAFPRHAVIFRTIKSAAWAATGEKPWLPPRLPKRCEHDVRIMRIENDVDPASVLIFR